MHLKKVSIKHERFPTREHYPFNLEIMQKTPGCPFTSPVTFFVGENGTGKSTLLEAVCRRCGIHIWEHEYRTRYEHNPFEHSLFQALDIEWYDGPVPGSYFASQAFQNFAEILDGWASSDPGMLKYFGGKSLMTQSHGQSLMSYFSSRYRLRGIYFLDEPETALSPKTQLALLEILKQAGEKGLAQFVIATHSPILLSCPGATIYSFDRVPLEPISYENTDHYRIYRDFMKERENLPE